MSELKILPLPNNCKNENMENKDEVRIDLLLAESNDIEKGDVGMEFPVAAFLKIGPEDVDFFIETLLKYICQEWSEWKDTRKSLEILKEDIKKFLNREKYYFTFRDLDYSLKNIPLISPEVSLDPKRHFPYIDIKCSDEYITDKAFGEGQIPNLFVIKEMYDDSVASIPLVTKSNWPGLSINGYMPFTIKDNKLYMFDCDGNICGGPYVNAKHLLGHYYGVESEDGKKNIVDLNGKILIDDVDEYNEEVYTDGFGEIELFGLYSKNGKLGFFTQRGNIGKAIYDDKESIQIREDGKFWAYGSTGDQNGYSTPAVDFEPFPERTVDYNNEDGDEDLPF